MLGASIYGLQTKTTTSKVATRKAQIDSKPPDKVSSIVARFEALSSKSYQRPLIQVLPQRRPKSNIVTRHYLERTSRSQQKEDKTTNFEDKPDTMYFIRRSENQHSSSSKSSRRASTPSVATSELRTVPSWEKLLRRASVTFKQGPSAARTDTTSKETPIDETMPRRRPSHGQKKAISVMNSPDPKLPAPRRESKLEAQDKRRQSSCCQSNTHDDLFDDRIIMHDDLFADEPLQSITHDDLFDDQPTPQQTDVQFQVPPKLDSLAGPEQQPVVERHNIYAPVIIHEKKSSIASLKAVCKSLDQTPDPTSSKPLMSKTLNLAATAPLHATTTATVSIDTPIVEQVGQASNRTHEGEIMVQNKTQRSTKSIDVLKSFYNKPTVDKASSTKRKPATPPRISLRSIISKFGFMDKQSNSKSQDKSPSITSRVKIALARRQSDTDHQTTLQPRSVKHDDLNDLTLSGQEHPTVVPETNMETTITQDNGMIRFSNPFLSGDGTSSASNDLIKSTIRQHKYRATPFKISDVTIRHYSDFVNVDHEPVSPKFHSTVTARSIRLLIDSYSCFE